MGIMGIHAIPMRIACMLQGTLCDPGIPCTFYGEKFAVHGEVNLKLRFLKKSSYYILYIIPLLPQDLLQQAYVNTSIQFLKRYDNIKEEKKT